MTQEHALAQLRHLYLLMLAGNVKDCEQAAHGLLGPAIEWLEVARRAEQEQAIKALADALREHGAHPRDCGTWLSNGDFDEERCSCGIAAALRLAGRLP